MHDLHEQEMTRLEAFVLLLCVIGALIGLYINR